MGVHWIDWSILGAMAAIVVGVTLFTKRYMRSIADFLAADRLAGRYLLTVASGFFGAISLVATWEMTYSTGLPPTWWAMIGAPVGLFLGLTGFITYRFRQTRALTLAQFLEERYSRKFRYYAGLLCWISGVLNYGIFPLITANLLIYFLAIPPHFQLWGVTVATLPVVMAVYLGLAVFIACSGGQITIMITDFLQGAFMMLTFVAIMIYLLCQFSWGSVMEGLAYGAKPGESMINPFGGSATDDFSIWYFLIGVFSAVYNARSWQGNSGYGAAAKTPHEAVVAGVIGGWRGMAQNMCVLLIPLIAFAVMHLPAFEHIAAPIQEEISNLGDKQLQTQMTVPLFLKHVLPVGFYGLFAAIILGCALSCDDTYTHSWGTILVQDVIIPLRNKPFATKTHFLVLRLSILGVALFGFFFSLLFPMKDYILMFFALTGAIYLGGAGAVIIGGLYWRRGTTAAAWTALTIGTVLGFGGVVIQQCWEPFIDAFMDARKLGPVSGLAIICGFIFIVLLVVGALLWTNRRKAASINILIGVVVGIFGLTVWSNWGDICQYIQSSPALCDYLVAHKTKFPINGQWIYFWAMLTASVSYVLVSLVGPRTDFNMDKLLHRGKYAIASDRVKGDETSERVSRRITFSKLVGVTAEFSRFERLLFYCSFAWSMGWWGIFVVGTVVNLFYKVSDNAWSWYWWFYIWVSVFLGIMCTVWVFCGGIRDARRLFHDLTHRRIDMADDGFVRDTKK